MHKWFGVTDALGVRGVVLALTVGTLSVSLVAQAATTPPDAGDLLRREQELDRLRDLPQSIPLPKKAVPSAAPAPQDSVRISVKSFRIEGQLESIPEADIQAVLKGAIGQRLTYGELLGWVAKVTELYKSRGFFLARAVLPPQDVTDGVVVVRIIEGRLDPQSGIRFKGDTMRLNQDFARGVVLKAIGQKGAIKESLLERGTLNLNDNPGFATSVLAEPGDTPETVRLVFESVEGPLVVGSVVVDNFGSRYTGDWRYTGNVNINNPSRYGDQVQASYTNVFDGNFETAKLGYGFPIGKDGLRGNVSYTDLSFGVGKELASLGAKGQAGNTNATLKYPFYRTQVMSVNGTLAYDWKALKNESGGAVSSDKRIDVGAATLSLERADQIGGGGFTVVSLTRSNGKVDLSRNADNLSDDETLGYNTRGSFGKTGYQIVRIQRGSKRISFQGTLSGQFADKNLDGSEDFSLGGPAGVKGYPGGEASGDEGHKFSFEARYTALTETKVGDWLLQFFYDTGRIKQYKDTSQLSSPPTKNSYSLSSWGLGLNVVAAGKHDVKIGWARVIGSNPGATTDGNNSDGLSKKSRFWVYVSKEF
jgi:hemolysin activation/secretion protein